MKTAIHPITASKKNLEEPINKNETNIEEILGSIKEIPVDMRNGPGELNKDFVVTLIIMDENGTIYPIKAFKKNLEEHINESETKMKK